MAGEGERAGKGGRHGVEHVHGAVVAFQDEIHFKLFLRDVEELGSNSWTAPFMVVAFGHALGEDRGKCHHLAPRVFGDFFHRQTSEIESSSGQ